MEKDSVFGGPYNNGIDLRNYIAIEAMKAIIIRGDFSTTNPERISEVAYNLSDCMITERTARDEKEQMD